MTGKEEFAEIEKSLEKKKRKRPDLENFGAEKAEPGDNARYLRYARMALDLPPIDISDPRQVERRIGEYFDHCEKYDRKPQMVGMANWLGISRDTLNSWKRGEYRRGTHSDLIEKAMQILEEMYVDYMMNGKVNPGSGCFIGKNHFGYHDDQHITIAPESPLGPEPTPDEIAEKWKMLPPD